MCLYLYLNTFCKYFSIRFKFYHKILCSFNNFLGVSSTSISTFDFSDVGDFINVHPIPFGNKYNLLINPYTPNTSYNFKNNMQLNFKCPFNLKYLDAYDWVIYLPKHKRVFCKFCVLFNLNILRNKQGSFIIKTFTKMYQINNESKKNIQYNSGIESTITAKSFLQSMTFKI